MPWDDLHEPRGPQDPSRPGSPKPGGEPPKGGPIFDIPRFNIPKFKPSAFWGGAVLLILLWIVPGVFYFVEPDEAGVITRFGKYLRTTEPGIHFKFPSPIEQVFTPKVKQVRRTEIGFRVVEAGPPQKVRDVPNESLMLTGDQNLVDIDLVVQYQIKDAVAYLFNIRNKTKLVRDVAETVLRGIVGEKHIDEVLTSGKAEIQLKIKDTMQLLLDQYVSGIQVVTAQLQDVHPPTQVAAAFKDVVSAREDKERMVNEAQGYSNAVIPETRGRASQIVREAEAYREEKLKKSQGDANRFLAQYEEYRKAPDITRKRIYIETMEEILPEVQKYIMGDNKTGVLPLLPLANALGVQKTQPAPQQPTPQN
jgi:membrane protease subunit HflK